MVPVVRFASNRNPACMTLRSLALLLVLTACSSTPKMELELGSTPQGAQVFLSRRGERAYEGKLGPLKGDVKSDELEEGFALIGTSPLTYVSPLRETESDATLFGVGAKVVLKYKDCVVRFVKPGFETVERHVLFQEGEVRVQVKLPRAQAAAGQ